MHVKRTLDEALLEAPVDFLFGCHPADLLVDADGAVAGEEKWDEEELEEWEEEDVDEEDDDLWADDEEEEY